MMRKSLAMALLSPVGAFFSMDKAVMAMVKPTSAFAEPSRSRSRSQINKYRAQGSTWSYPAHDGHSVAHGKRLAAKARNQSRHKRATKGK